MVSLSFTSLNIYVMYSSIKICYSITSRCSLGEFNYLKWWSCCRWLSLLALCPLSLQLLQVGSNYWMAWASPSREGDTGNSSTTKLVLVYTALSFGSSLFVIVRTLFVYMCGQFISQKYFFVHVWAIHISEGHPVQHVLSSMHLEYSEQSTYAPPGQPDISSLLTRHHDRMELIETTTVYWAVTEWF